MPSQERLPDKALVIRCGQPPFDALKVIGGCRKHPDGFFGFSVQCASGEAIESLAAWCPNGKIGCTTVEAIRSLGYEIVTTSGDGYHATVVIPSDGKPEAIQALLDLFEERANPVPKGSRLR